jgi:hypothetical protein
MSHHNFYTTKYNQKQIFIPKQNWKVWFLRQIVIFFSRKWRTDCHKNLVLWKDVIILVSLIKGVRIGVCHFHFQQYLFYAVSTRRVSHVEQELLTLLVHPSSPPVFSRVHVAPTLVFCVMFCRSLFVLLAIVFSVLLRLQLLITPLVSSNFSYCGRKA